MLIKNFIKNKLNNLLNESFAKSHFIDRVYDRLKSQHTNFTSEKPEIKEKVFDDIDFLIRSVKFPGNYNIGIYLNRGSMGYIYKKEIGGKIEMSDGPYIWVIIRGNDLETLVFSTYERKPQNTQIHISINKLRDYILKVKNGDGKLTDKDIKNLVTPETKNEPKSVNPNQIVLNIKGVKYILDKESERVFKKNKPAESYSIWDLPFDLDDESTNKIYSLL